MDNLDIRLRYRPLEAGNEGQLSVKELRQYQDASGLASLVDQIVIKPFDEALKRSKKTEFDFEEFKVTKTIPKEGSTKWKEVVNKLIAYLEIRADDSRNLDFMEDLQFFEGVGYCVSSTNILDEIEKYIEENTGPPGSPKLNWPSIKKSEKLPKTIQIPQRDYSKITKENAITALRAKRFKRGIEKAVIDEYRRANELWFSKETGFDREKIPKKKDSPLSRVREIGPNAYVLILMTREEKPDYRKAVAMMQKELKKLSEEDDGKLRKLYRVKEDAGMLYINIQKLGSRLEELLKPNVNARYVIVP